ncbi:MAG: DUF429 domain-containing protein [Planctomycetota bacterium]
MGSVKKLETQPNRFRRIVGIDFSGAAQSGKTAWAAELVPVGSPFAEFETSGTSQKAPPFELVSLASLGRLAGSDERISVNQYLVDRIRSESETFWGCDFPFGLPIELLLGAWRSQLSHIKAFAGDAKKFGLSLVEKTKETQGKLHVRRDTDRETQTPFDCYHYRIIYQTFHGMRDVLAQIATRQDLAVLPFQYAKFFSGVSSVIVEACPASTLKRNGLPHQRYKQSGGKAPSREHLSTRREIMRWVGERVAISDYRKRVIRQDSGGDALDAVLAAIGAWEAFVREDHRSIATHKRYPKEGFVYA